MPDETYYVVINDNPMSGVSQPCVTGPSDELDFHREKDAALDRRNLIREQYENPDITVYRVTIHEGSIEREVEQ